jgi:hypothetical protein
VDVIQPGGRPRISAVITTTATTTTVARAP